MPNQITCDVDGFPATMSRVDNNQPMHVKCQWLTSWWFCRTVKTID